MIDKSSLLKYRIDCIWNLFPKMGYSTRFYYCRLWDFKLVDVTCTRGDSCISGMPGCVDPMHSQKLDIVSAVSSLYLNNLALPTWAIMEAVSDREIYFPQYKIKSETIKNYNNSKYIVTYRLLIDFTCNRISLVSKSID